MVGTALASKPENIAMGTKVRLAKIVFSILY
jgi:hypothetical protein